MTRITASNVRSARSPEETRGLDTDELRNAFLVDDLFAVDEFRAVYSHEDRVVLAGAQPVGGPVRLESPPAVGDDFFAGREAGIVTVGGSGTVTVDGTGHHVGTGDCLYIGRGAGEVDFASDDADRPARFYLFSTTAHATHATVLATSDEANRLDLGTREASNVRTIRQYIHEGGIQSSQLVMGITTLAPENLWNTMPPHTHTRRTECYLYFDLPAQHRVLHLMGEPQETRHLVVADGQAVISPHWSIHAGVGTASYSFVWAMGGENQAFGDMQAEPITELR